MLSLIVLLLAQARPMADATPRSKALVARLEEPVSLAFRLEVPLAEALGQLGRSLRKGPDGPPVPIYFDPRGFGRADKTPFFPVVITAEAIPAGDALGRLLDPLGLAYTVRDGLLIISDPQGIRREGAEADVRAADESPATAELMARLEEPARLHFPDETPLGEVLGQIEKITSGRQAGRGIRLLPVREGFKEANASLESAVVIDVDGVPLRTSIRLLLDQLGLACIARNGRLVIHSRRGIEKMIRAVR